MPYFKISNTGGGGSEPADYTELIQSIRDKGGTVADGATFQEIIVALSTIPEGGKSLDPFLEPLFPIPLADYKGCFIIERSYGNIELWFFTGELRSNPSGPNKLYSTGGVRYKYIYRNGWQFDNVGSGTIGFSDGVEMLRFSTSDVIEDGSEKVVYKGTPLIPDGSSYNETETIPLLVKNLNLGEYANYMILKRENGKIMTINYPGRMVYYPHGDLTFKMHAKNGATIEDYLYAFESDTEGVFLPYKSFQPYPAFVDETPDFILYSTEDVLNGSTGEIAFKKNLETKFGVL